MIKHQFSDFSYAVNTDSAKKGNKEILVCFIYNGVEVLKKIYIPEKAGTAYVFEAKKIIDNEMRDGTLATYAHKFVAKNKKKNEPNKQPTTSNNVAASSDNAPKASKPKSKKGLLVALIVVSILFVAALVLAIVFMLKKPETPEPSPVVTDAKITLNAGSDGVFANGKDTLTIYLPYGEKWGDYKDAYAPTVVHPEAKVFNYFVDGSGNEFSGDNIIGETTPTTLTAKYEDLKAKDFETDPWLIISAEANKGTEAWAYGDVLGKTRTVKLFDKEYTVKVIGIDDDKTTNDNKSATLTFEFQDVITDGVGYAKTGPEGADTIEYETSNLRSYLNETVYNALPDDLRKAIVEVNKSTYRNDSKEVSNTSDRLFPLSLREMNYTTDPEGLAGDTELEGSNYDGYNFEDPLTPFVKKFNGVDTAYWLRSPSPAHEGSAWGFDTDGYLGHIDQFTERSPYDMICDLGVSPAFCIGSH